MLTVDEQLDQALALIKHLEADARAGTTLLSEASTKIDGLTIQATELHAERERLAADLLTARQSIESLGKQTGEAETRLAQVTAKRTTCSPGSRRSLIPRPRPLSGVHLPLSNRRSFSAALQPTTSNPPVF